MAEPNHAQEHHLRMAANRAVKFAEQASLPFESVEQLIQCAVSKAKQAPRYSGVPCAEHCEFVASLFLRAAVWLRRSK